MALAKHEPKWVQELKIKNPCFAQGPATGGFVVSGVFKIQNLNRMSGALVVSNSEISHLRKLTRDIAKMVAQTVLQIS
jgi:pyridoxal biosynthesis lyase PdxS